MNEFGRQENLITDEEITLLMEQFRDKNLERVLVDSGSVNEQPKETLRSITQMPVFSNEYEGFLKRIEKGGHALHGELVHAVANGSFEPLFAKLLRAVDAQKISKEEIFTLIVKEQRRLPPWALNRLAIFKKILE